MENSSAITSPETIPLTKTCFIDEQDRLDTFARHMRIPVEAGKSIPGEPGPKGDKGDTGARGPRGEQGEQGEKGDIGSITNNTAIIDIPIDSLSIDVAYDLVGAIVNLKYNNSLDPPVDQIGIRCFRTLATDSSRIFFDNPISDDKYQLVITKITA